MVVDMAVDDSSRVRSAALPLAMILDRELILSVQSAVVCSTSDRWEGLYWTRTSTKAIIAEELLAIVYTLAH